MVGLAAAESAADAMVDDSKRVEQSATNGGMAAGVLDDEHGSGSGSGNGTGTAGSSDTVATFAAPIGIIEPPPEVKIVIDRTAEFVRKTGTAGEEQLLAKNRNNRKFAFLTPQSPYHTYYKQRVKVGADSATTQHTADEQSRREEEERRERERVEAEEREERRKREEREADARKPRTLQQRLQSMIEASRLDAHTSTAAVTATAGTSNGSSAVTPLFRIPHPSHYSSAELDVVHLTALYSCHLGAAFLSSLQQRERTNSAFDFLKPQHPLYSYYGGVRQAMERILRHQTQPLLDEYTQYIAHPTLLLARLMEAARRKRREQAEDDARQREAQEDSEVMSAIDWQSFIVVETVEFSADEVQYLPQPKQSIAEMEAMIAELAIEEEREREERERQEVERKKHERHEQEVMQLEAAAAAEAAASMPPPASSTAAGAVIEHSENEQLEVRTNVAVPAASVNVSAAPSLSSKLVTCVVCGDTIAAEDLEEHLRIELLDPRWKEQKQALIDRQRETSLVAGKSISDNLRRFERKKREVGRERSREEEERQEREDAALLRGAAREDSRNTLTQRSAQSAASLPPSTATSAAVSTTTAGPAATSSSSPLPRVIDEPLTKRARPTSPAPSAPTASFPSPSATAPSSPPATASLDPSSHHSTAGPASTSAVPVSSASLSSIELPSSVQSTVPSTASVKANTAQLVDENVWLSAHPMELTVLVRVPLDAASPFHLAGQELSVRCRLTDIVDVLKAAVSEQCNALPANRQQFQLLSGAFLKEGHTLAYYNVYDGAVLTLKLKERGGKRK